MSQDNTTEERVVEIVARVFHKNVVEINPETSFVDDLFAKSINFIELLAILEDEMNIPAIPVSKARQMKTVGDTVELVAGLIA